MEKDLESLFFDETCKENQIYTEKIEVSFNAFESLQDFLLCKNYKNILVFDSLGKSEQLDILCQNLGGINIEILSFIEPFALVETASKLQYKEADVVVALGSEELISIAKYYAYVYELPLIIYPVGNFADFTFSSFARLFDGTGFDFYKTTQPIAIFVSLKENKLNKFQTYFISSKFIANFDNLVAVFVFQKQSSEKLKNYFSNILINYLDNKKANANLNERNIWTLIRLGLGMTFFKETKYFYGSDKAVCDFLQAQSFKSDFLEVQTIALKLVINAYSCFLKNPQKQNNFNLNKHINAISRILKLPSTEVLKKMADSGLLCLSDTLERNFNNYQPYLKNQFEKTMSKVFKIQTSLCLNENIVVSSGFDAYKVQRSFALSANFYNRPTLLHLIESYGFMDKLLNWIKIFKKEIIFYGDDFFMKRFLIMAFVLVLLSAGIFFGSGSLSSLLKESEGESLENVSVKYANASLGFLEEEVDGKTLKFVSNGKVVGECIFTKKSYLSKLTEKLGLMITNKYVVGNCEIIEGVSPLSKFSISGRQANIQISIKEQEVIIASPIIYGSF